MPKVYNIENAPKDAVYIGRNTPYENPYENGRDKEPATKLFVKNILPNLDVSRLKGKNLKCLCNLVYCHGHHIIDKANN